VREKGGERERERERERRYWDVGLVKKGSW
jgi:hypothetical protein